MKFKNKQISKKKPYDKSQTSSSSNDLNEKNELDMINRMLGNNNNSSEESLFNSSNNNSEKSSSKNEFSFEDINDEFGLIEEKNKYEYKSDRIKILSGNDYEENLIEKLNKDLTIEENIDEIQNANIINDEDRTAFINKCNITYQELKERGIRIPTKLRNIIANLQTFSTSIITIDDLFKSDLHHILFKNISSPYDQLIDIIIGDYQITDKCLVCALANKNNPIANKIKLQIRKYTSSKNFCKIVASLMISIYANKKIEKHNKLYTNNRDLQINDVWSKQEVLIHLIYHDFEPENFLKQTLRDLKEQEVILKKNGLFKTFSTNNNQGIQKNIFMVSGSQKMYHENIKMQITIYEKLKKNSLGTESNITNEQLIEKTNNRFKKNNTNKNYNNLYNGQSLLNY